MNCWNCRDKGYNEYESHHYGHGDDYKSVRTCNYCDKGRMMTYNQAVIANKVRKGYRGNYE